MGFFFCGNICVVRSSKVGALEINCEIGGRSFRLLLRCRSANKAQPQHFRFWTPLPTTATTRGSSRWLYPWGWCLCSSTGWAWTSSGTTKQPQNTLILRLAIYNTHYPNNVMHMYGLKPLQPAWYIHLFAFSNIRVIAFPPFFFCRINNSIMSIIARARADPQR